MNNGTEPELVTLSDAMHLMQILSGRGGFHRYSTDVKDRIEELLNTLTLAIVGRTAGGWGVLAWRDHTDEAWEASY